MKGEATIACFSSDKKMVFNNTGITEVKNNQSRNAVYQSNTGNRQSKRYDNTRKNSKASNNGSSYQNNRYSKEIRKQPRRDKGRYDKETKPKYYNNSYNSQRSVNKVPIEESIDEIKNDIERLYKEIKVEIELIKSIKFF